MKINEEKLRRNYLAKANRIANGGEDDKGETGFEKKRWGRGREGRE